MDKTIRVALAGNPNTGKSTIFNALTGEHQQISNWSGTTVVRKTGWFTYEDIRVTVVDLPGAYSLSAYSPEEQIARDYIVHDKPDVVVNVVDASSLERNLYLTAQILETGASVILALNMQDMAGRRGYHIDRERLMQLLPGIPLVEMTASQGTGIDELRRVILDRVPHVSANNRIIHPENQPS